MISFKQYISEGSRGEYTTKSYIFDKYLYPALILSSTALERVFGKLNKIIAWHVTEQYHIGELVKLQGKKSSISALTEINPSKSKPFEGMETDGGVVVEWQLEKMHGQNYSMVEEEELILIPNISPIYIKI